MADESNIPVLTDLIEKGIRIKMSDLGLGEDLVIEDDDFGASPVNTRFGEPGAVSDVVEPPGSTYPEIQPLATRQDWNPAAWLEDPGPHPVVDPLIDEELPTTSMPRDPFASYPQLEQTIRSIFNEHLELALQEIRLALQNDDDSPPST